MQPGRYIFSLREYREPPSRMRYLIIGFICGAIVTAAILCWIGGF